LNVSITMWLVNYGLPFGTPLLPLEICLMPFITTCSL